MTTYNKPLPNVDDVSKGFWDAAKRHELAAQRCKTCNHLIFYPRPACTKCLSMDLEWVQLTGKGRVYTFTIINQAAIPGFMEDVPYVLAIVQLNEGPRITTNIVECKPEDVKVDMPVTVVFDDVTPEITLVKFKPV